MAGKQGHRGSTVGTIEIGPEFIGIKDADGNVLIDDTAYFRHREIEDFQRKAREWFRRHQQEKNHAER